MCPGSDVGLKQNQWGEAGSGNTCQFQFFERLYPTRPWDYPSPPQSLSSGADMDLAQWLAELGLGQYAAAFTENDIDFDVLAQLTDADLKELGVRSLGNRKRPLAAIAARAPVSAVPVSPADISKGERRQVTILFADLCGYTALAQSLDPEEVRELVARYTALLDGIVVSYGATVDKHIGDAVMALFGAPKAHDDDPLRAARAALDIHDAVEQLTDSRGRPLRAHVGQAARSWPAVWSAAAHMTIPCSGIR